MGEERGISQAINSYLQYQENLGKLLFQRNNSFSGCITRRNGSQGYIKNSKKGAPDYYIFMPSGITIMAEIKADKGKQSAEQKDWEIKSKKLGHKYYVIKSVDDLERALLLSPYKPI